MHDDATIGWKRKYIPSSNFYIIWLTIKYLKSKDVRFSIIYINLLRISISWNLVIFKYRCNLAHKMNFGIYYNKNLIYYNYKIVNCFILSFFSDLSNVYCPHFTSPNLLILKVPIGNISVFFSTFRFLALLTRILFWAFYNLWSRSIQRVKLGKNLLDSMKLTPSWLIATTV